MGDKVFKGQTPDTDIAVIDKRHSAQAPAVQDEGPSAAIMLALKQGTDPGIIEKLMDLAERQEANINKKAFVKAMAEFKANPPEIDKDKTVSFGQGKTSYTHASLANVTAKINSALSEYGLSASWKTAQTENLVTVTCTITHEYGHSEATSLTAAPDTSGSKNTIQAIGSTISYLERYTLLALTGLATHDMDNDAQAPTEKITTDQATELSDLLEETSSNVKIFLKVAGADCVENITADKYPMLINQLKTKQKQMRQPGE